MPGTHLSFQEHLTAHMIPEWKRQYVCYEELISTLMREQRRDFLYGKHSGQKHLRLSYGEFLKRCDMELDKVKLFFSEKLSEANRRLAAFGIVVPDSSEAATGVGPGLPEKQRYSKRQKIRLNKLKMAVGEFYLSLAFLQSYQELNYKAFCKITKKHDVIFTSESGLQWKTEKLDTTLLYTQRSRCEEIMFRLETFMLQLEGGNEKKAMRRLKVPPWFTEQTAGLWITFRIGVTSGLMIALITFIAFKAHQASKDSQLDHQKPLLELYRGSFLLIELLSLMALSMHCWRSAGINQVLIFELDSRQHLLHYHILEVAGWLAVCWCASILACLHPSFNLVPQQIHPLCFHSLLLLLLLNPISCCHSQSRQWLLSVMGKVLTAPLWPVGFADCWLADQLNSLSPLFLNMWDMLCFYSLQINWADLQDGSTLYTESNDWKGQKKIIICLIQCFPPWLRFAQCLRHFWDSGHNVHLLNAGKYSTVFLMVIFAGLYNTARETDAMAMDVRAYLYLWAMATCISVIATVSWDLRMDWGLLQGNGLLKEELIYPQEWYYYAAMLADVLLRISWAINILLAQMKDSAAAATASAILAPLEVLRRSIWNCFRLENEHLKNCSQCRAVQDFDLQQQFFMEKLTEQDESNNISHKSSNLRPPPNCFPFRYIRPAVKEYFLPVRSPEMEPTKCL